MKEAFRVLSAGVQVHGLGKNINTLLITSTGPKEGKSLVTANLAMALAESGRKVMIIDADLRNPVQHKIWGIDPNSAGLTSVLSGEINDPMEAVKQTKVKNLTLMPAGSLPPDPGEIISSASPCRYMEEVKKQAEIILFDTPSLLTVSDTVLLSSHADGVLFVIAARLYKRETIKKAVDLLGNLCIPILGVVLVCHGDVSFGAFK